MGPRMRNDLGGMRFRMRRAKAEPALERAAGQETAGPLGPASTPGSGLLPLLPGPDERMRGTGVPRSCRPRRQWAVPRYGSPGHASRPAGWRLQGRRQFKPRRIRRA